MNESIRDFLAREAEEAEAAADAQESIERPEVEGQRARAQVGDASQVYSVRIPVDRLEELRGLAAERGLRPTALLRQFVLERLAQETAPVVTSSERDPNELRLGPPRGAPFGEVIPLKERRG